MRTKHFLPALLLALACGGGGSGDPTPPPMMESEDYPLSAVDPLFEGAPGNDELPEEGKADQTLPAQFDLVATQSPVKSQGSRGVCSIFGTTALMEHLYIVDGTLPMPDFSEQFLQWSSKVEYGSFQNTSGSSANVNINTLNRYGSVLESDWPYESQPWGSSDDEACTGDSQPVRCYTNGDPPAAALDARRWHIPRGRWINSRARSIKSHMFNTNNAVQAGGAFFYQAWNHGRTQLDRGTEFRAYRDQGYILSPTQADIEDSSGERRAGHSYLLVGWDDELEVQRIGDDGELLFDESGDPVMEKGFFLFKNSWGTGWAGSNPHGAGYGWISYDYVEEHLTVYASGVPEVMIAEVCGDGRDNDFNGATDCADAACSGDRSCVDPAGSYENTTATPIPDNDSVGASSDIEVPDGGTISGVSVSVDITHTYRGDLTVQLVKGSTTATLFEREGAGDDDLVRTFDVSDFDGEDAAGTWTLRVIDNANADTGTLNGWSLTVTRCAGGDCGAMPEVSTYTNDTLFVIPDNATGESDIEVSESGDISAVRVTVDMTHTYFPELTVSLRHDDLTVELLHEEYFEGETLNRTFTLADFNGYDMNGTWTLVVTDGAAMDEGTVNSWSLEITR